jgi:hypothetical protein
MLAVLVFSTWAPFPVYAQPSTVASEDTASLIIELKETKKAKLTVDNRTGGTLYVSLSGPRSYYFSTSKKGKTTFNDIEPGKYTVTVRTSACSDTLTYQQNIKGTASLKPFGCSKQTKTKLGSLTVDNRTGGTLYVSLSGPGSYYFSTSKKGKTTFKDIEPGKYTITVRSSACSGTLTYQKNIKGTTSLKPFVCR